MSEKVRENRLRRTAERRGFQLHKSRRRDPLALDFGGWRVIDAETGETVLGGKHGVDLNEVEAFLDRRTG